MEIQYLNIFWAPFPRIYYFFGGLWFYYPPPKTRIYPITAKKMPSGEDPSESFFSSPYTLFILFIYDYFSSIFVKVFFQVAGNMEFIKTKVFEILKSSFEIPKIALLSSRACSLLWWMLIKKIGQFLKFF